MTVGRRGRERRCEGATADGGTGANHCDYRHASTWSDSLPRECSGDWCYEVPVGRWTLRKCVLYFGKESQSDFRNFKGGKLSRPGDVSRLYYPELDLRELSVLTRLSSG
jgi:hypothetical protein